MMNVASEGGMMGAVLPDVCFPSEMHLDSAMGLAKSPSPLSEFLVDEEAESTCPLLTPSPPTECNHLPSSGMVAYERQIDPSAIDDLEMLSLPKLNGIAATGYGGIIASEHNNNHGNREQAGFACQNTDPSVMGSSSSSSSVLQEPTVCAQLLSTHLYQHLTKSGNADAFTSQENGGKPPLAGLPLAMHKSPGDFCFLNWNWPVIRKLSFWGYISLLVGCVCIVVGLMAKLPAVCNPEHGWWQGTIFYEVFPASFQDSNSDGIGDLRGLSARVPYLKSLGVQAVRLNYIFMSNHYPENYNKVNNLTKMDPSLGDEKDFDYAITLLHTHNISVVLDLPVEPFVNHYVRNENVPTPQSYESTNKSENSTPTEEFDRVDAVSNAITYWLDRGVDGFYLKGLEEVTENPNFTSLVKSWRKLADRYSNFGAEKILMCSCDVLAALNHAKVETVNAVLYSMDLVDVRLETWLNGTAHLKEQVDQVLHGMLYAKPGYPWVHWHLAGVDTQRLASQVERNTSFALLMFQLMLPGTQSIFYGDEIQLQESYNPYGEHHDLRHLHQLPPMQWNRSQFTTQNALPWLPPAPSANLRLQLAVGAFARLRAEAPPIYMNGVWKDHEIIPNTEIRVVHKDVVVVERRYPRRNSYVLVCNLAESAATHDLSVHYFGGQVAWDRLGRAGQYLTFHALMLDAGEAIVIRLDK